MARLTRLPRRLGAACAAAAALAVAVSASGGEGGAVQGVRVSELTAAFLYNFAKFTEWPPEALPPASALALCVADSDRVARALHEAVAGRDIAGHPLIVRRMARHDPSEPCHLLYADDFDAERGRRLVEGLKGAPVLTVSDFAEFTDIGGAIYLFEDRGKMRFAVNVGAAQRARLRLSSRLLSLAKVIKGQPHADER